MELLSQHPVRSTLQERRRLVRIVIVAVVLATGVNLLCNGLALTYQAEIFPWMIALGLFLIVGSIAFLAVVPMQPVTFPKRFRTVAAIDKETLEFLPAAGCDLADDLWRVHRAITHENRALNEDWKAGALQIHLACSPPNPVSLLFGKNQADSDSVREYVAGVRMGRKTPSPEAERAVRLLHEILEFILLKHLSMHLDEYFKNLENSESFVTSYTRNELPDILVSNRVVATITSPIEDRPIYRESGLFKNKPPGEVLFIFGTDGTTYETFTLTLPRHSKVSRDQDGRLCISSPFLDFKLSVHVSSSTDWLGKELLQAVFRGNKSEFESLTVTFACEVGMRKTALSRFRGWRLYEWIDSFIDHLSELTDVQSQLRCRAMIETLREKSPKEDNEKRHI